MIKKLLVISFLIVGVFTMSSCTSFNNSRIKDSINDYFDWFDDFLGVSENPNNNSNYNDDFVIILDKDKIIF